MNSAGSDGGSAVPVGVGRIAVIAFKVSGNVTSLTLLNQGAGPISQLSAACTASGGSVVTQPSTVLAAGATTEVQLRHLDGKSCDPVFTGINAVNSPLSLKGY